MVHLKKIFLLTLALSIFACSDVTDIGEDLLSDEKLDLGFVKDLPIVAKTFESENPISFSFKKNELTGPEVVTPERAIIGEYLDPVFGKVSSDFYTRIVYNPSVAIPIFKDLSLDSAVLIMLYDTLAFYGPRATLHDLSVYEIVEDYDAKDTFYVSDKLEVKPTPIAQKSFIPNIKDSITIIDHNDSSKLRLASQLRIRLDDTWAQNFVKQPAIAEGNSTNPDNALFSVFKGFKISSNSNGKGLLGFNTTTAAISSTGLCRMTLYFSTFENKKLSYSFSLSNQKFNSVSIDKSKGSVVDFFGSETRGDSLLFLQSLNGPAIEMEFKDLSVLKGKNIVKAELILTLANPQSENLKEYFPVNTILASKYNTSGKLSVIKDISDLASTNVILALGYGGSIKKQPTGEQTYSLNITKHMKELLENDMSDKRLVLTASSRSISPTRCIVYGPKHSKYPLRLKVTYSN